MQKKLCNITTSSWEPIFSPFGPIRLLYGLTQTNQGWEFGFLIKFLN